MEKALGVKVRELRLANGMSQQELGNIVGLTATGVSYWESGKAMPSIDALEKVSEYFGVSVDYLLGNDELEDKAKALLKKVSKVKKQEDKEKLYSIISRTIDVFLQSA